MISSEVFTIDWIYSKVNNLKKASKNIDPILLEKVTKAIYLLECLTNSKLEFTFKGGTSVILLLGNAKRFSIDIDIIVDKDISVFHYLDNITKKNEIFKRFEEDIRKTQADLPSVHYKFYYESLIDNRENYVLLDILFDKNSYTEIQETYIQCNLIDTVEPILKVKTPSINCILGDKLTAFAPNTTGIIYGQKKELEIIKQLYDISCLFDLSSDIDTVRETFIRTVNKQIEYRSLSITYNDVLKDIFKTSLILASRGSIESDMFKELENGVKKMRGYVLTNRSFIIEEAIECSAKAAYLSMLLTSPLDKIEKFDNSIDLSKVRVKNRIINSIKKFSPEGFFYWFKAIELCETYEQSKRTYEFTIPSKGISL